MGGKESNIQETEHWHLGENRDVGMPVVDASGNPVDLTGMTLRFRVFDRRGGTVLLTKDSPTLSNDAGTLDRATVTILTGDYTLLVKGKTYYYEWQRTDSGEEGVLAFGHAVIRSGGALS